MSFMTSSSENVRRQERIYKESVLIVITQSTKHEKRQLKLRPFPGILPGKGRLASPEINAGYKTKFTLSFAQEFVAIAEKDKNKSHSF